MHKTYWIDTIAKTFGLLFDSGDMIMFRYDGKAMKQLLAMAKHGKANAGPEGGTLWFVVYTVYNGQAMVYSQYLDMIDEWSEPLPC